MRLDLAFFALWATLVKGLRLRRRRLRKPRRGHRLPRRLHRFPMLAWRGWWEAFDEEEEREAAEVAAEEERLFGPPVAPKAVN